MTKITRSNLAERETGNGKTCRHASKVITYTGVYVAETSHSVRLHHLGRRSHSTEPNRILRSLLSNNFSFHQSHRTHSVPLPAGRHCCSSLPTHCNACNV